MSFTDQGKQYHMMSEHERYKDNRWVEEKSAGTNRGCVRWHGDTGLQWYALD